MRGGGYYYEQLADADDADTDRAEETVEAKETLESENDNSDGNDDGKESSDETVETTVKETEVKDSEQTTETKESDETQASETKSSLSAETEETETEEVKTEAEKKTTEKNNRAPADGMVTYTSTYDFTNESIIPKDSQGNVKVTSKDGKLIVDPGNISGYSPNTSDMRHGVAFKNGNTITIHVLGDAKVFIGGCQYSGTGNGSASIMTVTHEETELYKNEDTKVDACYFTDSTKGFTINYTGEETDLVIAFSGEGLTYVPIILVERTEPAVKAKVTLADTNNVLGTGDTIKLVNEADTEDEYDITSATTETEFELRANATYNIVSNNKKIKATSDNKTTITTETDPITVTVTLEANEDVDQGPTKTYTSIYDFRDGSIIPTDTTNGTATVKSADEKLTVACGPRNGYGYNGAQHGSIFKDGNTITIHVLGKAKVFIGGCKHTNDTKTLTVKSGSTTIKTFESTKTTDCYDKDTAPTAGLSFEYDGEETDLVMEFGGQGQTYVPIITVERTEPIQMITYTSTYDFRDGSIIPTDTTNGTATVKSADEKLTVACGPRNGYGYNGAQHGSIFKDGNTITIHVLGKAKVFIGGCKHTNDTKTLTVKNGNTTIKTFESTKTTDCYDKDTAPTAGLSFEYDGEETDLVMEFGGQGQTYVPIITVERTEPKPDEVKATVTINDEKELLQDGDTIKLVNTADETDEIDITGAITQAMELTLPGNAVYNIVSSNSDIAADFNGRATVTTTTEDIEVTINLTATVVNPTVTISGADAVTGDYKLTLTNEKDDTDQHELKDGETVKLKIGETYKLESNNAEVDAKINGTILLTVAEDLAAITVEVSAPDTTHHTYDVWDFGAEELANDDKVTYNNRLTKEIINAWYPDEAPGSKLSESKISSDGADINAGADLTLVSDGNKNKWRLRALTTNKAITSEQTESSLTDEFGNSYQGIMYDNAGNGKMWMTLNVKAGDKVSAVVSSNGAASTITWESPSGKDVQTYEYTRGSRTKLANTIVFTASEDGAYKLYTPNEKLVVARIYRERPETVTVSGKVTIPDGASWETNSELIFTNQSTGTQTKAEVTGSTGEVSYTVKLQEQYGYDISAEGVEGCVVGAKNKIVLANEAGDTEFDFELIKVELLEVTGSLADLTPEAAAKLKLAFINTDKIYVPKITIDAENVTYTGKFEKDVEYTLQESGVNDYVLETETLKAESEGTINIKFTKKPVHAINVTLEGPTVEEAAQVKLTFTNINEEGYVYEFTGTEGIELRDGQYAVEAVLEGYTQKVTADVKVNGAAVDRTIVMLRNGSQEVAYKETITVGSESTYDYQSINDALEAVRNMKRQNGERVTISIAPGDYEEMLVVDTPNVTFKNASASPSIALKNKGVDIDENAVRITSYYGHGYTYYSMGDNCKWDADVLAANKENGYPSYINPGSGTTNGSYWNATVVISANGFQAEGIIFENSFNQYVSRKAADDIIVKQSGAKEGASARADMQYGDVTVQQKEYVERAAALAIYRNISQTYFENCKFIGRQDTLYGGVDTTAAFYKCSVYGGTDYIFGGMKAVFAKCDLVFNTNDQTDKGKKDDVGYITAAQQSAGRGYLLYNCHVTSTTPGVDTASEHTSKPGYLGRPWAANTGEAIFFYTVIDEADASWQDQYGKSLIMPAGWLNTLSGESALSQEYGTYEMAGVDNAANRVSWASVLEEPKIDGRPITVAKFLGSWNPFEGKDMTIKAGDIELEEPFDEEDNKPDPPVEEKVKITFMNGDEVFFEDEVVDDYGKFYVYDLSKVDTSKLSVPAGKRFVGWGTTPDSKEIIEPTGRIKVPPTGRTLYALIVDENAKICTVYFEGYDGEELYSTTVLENATITFDENYNERDKYTFVGWKIKGGEKVYKAGETYQVTDDVTFVETWEAKPLEKYTVTLVDETGKEIKKETVEEGTEFTLPETTNKKDGWFFAGWKSDYDDYVYAAGSKCVIEDNVTFKETWTQPSTEARTVTFADENGTKIGEQIIEAGGNPVITLPDSITKRIGYRFEGWEDNYNWDLYKVGASYTVTRDVTFYECWDWEEYEKGMYIRMEDEGVCYQGGAAVTPYMEVYYNGESLTQGTDYTVKYKNNKNAGTATLTVTGKNNFAGAVKKDVSFTIRPASLDNDIDDYAGTMTVIKDTTKVSPIITYKGKQLKLNKDFTISGNGLSDKGKYTEVTGTDDKGNAKYNTLKVTGINNYSGTLDINVAVIDKSEAKGLAVDIDKAFKPIYGNTLTWSDLFNGTITVYEKGDKSKTALKLGTDYTYAAMGSLYDVGTVKFMVVGIGKYCGTVTKSFKVSPKPLTQDELEISAWCNGEYKTSDLTAVYNSAGSTLNLRIRYKTSEVNGKPVYDGRLYRNRDYKVSYSGNKKVGTGKAKITFINDYKGTPTQTVEFAITGASLNNTYAIAPDMIYTKAGKAYASKPFVEYDGTIIKASEYTVSYEWASASAIKKDGTTEYTEGNKITLNEGDEYAEVKVTITPSAKSNFVLTNKDNSGTYIPKTTYYYVRKADSEKALDLSKAKVEFFSDKDLQNQYKKIPYCGSEFYTPEGNKASNVDGDGAVYVKVTVNKTTEVNADLYEVVWLNATNKGKATVVIKGKGFDSSAADKPFAVGSKTTSVTIDSIGQWVEPSNTWETFRSFLKNIF